MKRKAMTKDDPPVHVTSSQAMEQNVAMLKLNLNEPLTDQLAKHRFTQEEGRWREGCTEDRRPTDCDGRPTGYGGEGTSERIHRESYPSSEIVDLAVRRSPTDAAVMPNTDGGKRTLHGSRDVACENYVQQHTNGYEKPVKSTKSYVNGSINDDFKDQRRSEGNRNSNGVDGDRSKHPFRSSESSSMKPEATGKGLAPPPPLKKTADGGGGGGILPNAKPGSAFLPVDQQSREFTSGVPAVSYPFCVLPFQAITSGSVYPAMSPYPLPPSSSSSSSDHRLPKKVQSLSTGTPLSPFILYPEAHVTHQLEVLWQQKYPHFPVPPVWMLHQYTDELLRDISQLPSSSSSSSSAVDRLPGREFSGVSVVNSSPVVPVVPVVPSPVESIFVDKKRDRKEMGDRNFPATETKRTERSREEFQTRRKNDCKDRKNWRAYESDQQTLEKKRFQSDWIKSDQRRREEFLPNAQLHQRTELLVDQSASSACDAVDQHFQESLLRLNSQHLLDKSRNGRNIRFGVCDDRGTEKHGSSGYQHLKDAKNQNGMSRDQTRFSNFNPVSHHLASMTQKTQPGQIRFDIYGYQSQLRPSYSPEKVHSMAGKDLISSKPDRSLKNGYQEQPMLHFPTGNAQGQEHHQRSNSGFSGANPKMDAKDLRQDEWHLSNVVSSRIPDKQSTNVCPTKRLNDVKFSAAGTQSVASPTPGSVVKDSPLGPSRLIAGSPRPLPSVFYNPLDPRMEPVQPYQVSIEPIDRWPGSSSWTQYPVDWPVPKAFLNGVTSNGVQQQQRANSIPPEAHVKMQQGLIPNHVVHETGPGGSGLTCKAETLEPGKNQSISSSSYVANGPESLRSSSKRTSGRGDDAPQCLKRTKPSSSCPRNDESPLGSIDSFKSFVDRAVYNAFLEDSNRRSDRPPVSSVSPILKDFSLVSTMESDGSKQSTSGRRYSTASQLSDVLGWTMTAAASLTTSSHSPTVSDKKPHEMAARSSMTGSRNCSQVEPYSDTLSTLSCDTATSSDEQKGEAACSASTCSLRPLPLRSPPSPRASGGASLNLKKAWLARYSDVDQKSPPDAAASGFSGPGMDDPGFQDKADGSVGISKCVPSDETENQTSSAFESAIDEPSEAKRPVSAVTESKQPSEKDSDSSSEASVDSNSSRTKNSKNSKRRAPSELPTRCPKLPKTASNQKTSTVNDQNSRRLRGRNSRILDDCTWGVMSDSESKPTRSKKKTRVKNTQPLDLKDENLNSTDQSRKTSEVFLQDGPCPKVAQRLPKCRECKAQQANKSNSQTGNICKFQDFRKLTFSSKGALSVAGFLEPSDIEAFDLDLWMPSKSKQTVLTPVQAQYLVTHLGDFFTRILQQDTSLKVLESSDEDAGLLLWRRSVESVQETCDVCDVVIFDVHWTCKKCGFVACNSCRDSRIATDEADDETTDADDWPLCSTKRQIHDPDDLLLTRIIPLDALSAVKLKFSRLTEDNCRSEIITSNDNALNGKCCIKVKTEQGESKAKRNGLTDDIQSDSDVTLQCVRDDINHEAKPDSSVCEEAQFTVSDTSPGGASRKQDDLQNSRKEKTMTIVDCDSAAMPSLDFHGQLEIETTDDDEETLRLFQRRWLHLMPVVVRNCHPGCNSHLWKPDALLKRFGHLRLELVSCLNGAVQRFQSSEKLWNGSKNSSSAKMSGLLQFRDWPLPDDWAKLLSDHCLDLNRVLPISGYTFAYGSFNLASHLPEFFHQPDLATRINIGYGNLAQGHVSLAKMQMNPVDFVNVVMFAESRNSNDSLESRADHANATQLLQELDFDGNNSRFTENPEKIVAIWHAYHPMDSSKIEKFLDKIGGNIIQKSGEHNRSCVTSEAGCYLDAELRDKLRNETGVQATVVVQCHGDAVFIPATSFYQIKVVRECVSVTKEFISPESIESSFKKSTESSEWNNSSMNKRQEHFQIKNLVYHTMKDCISVLDESDS